MKKENRTMMNQETTGTLEIYATATCWMADFNKTSERETFLDAFGTTAVPLPYTKEMPGIAVRTNTQTRYPMTRVVICERTARGYKNPYR
jgi:hypothetical protein